MKSFTLGFHLFFYLVSYIKLNVLHVKDRKITLILLYGNDFKTKLKTKNKNVLLRWESNPWHSGKEISYQHNGIENSLIRMYF